MLPGWLAPVLAEVPMLAENVAGAVAFAQQLGHRLPLPGSGQTAQRWQILAAVAAGDLTVARVLEAHSDALTILAEADIDSDSADLPVAGSWGVFAAEAPGTRLQAVVDDRQWLLTGMKPWCSLGGVLDAALVTAHVEGGRRLFAVDLRDERVSADPPSAWSARGLRVVTSTSLHFSAAPATPVGAADWYLQRPGFTWGGMGVAACWFGAAWALRETLRAAAAERGGKIAQMHLGAVDVVLFGAQTVLRQAARDIDAGDADGPAGAVLALRVRSVVAAAAEETVHRVGHALGPAPLAFDAEHARRVADLQMYVRQHHGERDLAALGALLTAVAT